MNLLPKSKVEFSSKAYWENFFVKRKDAFEWYGEYVDLCELLDKYCKTTEKILMSGCGNSNLSEEMYDVGYHDIVNVDISDVVLKQMNSKSKGRMSYLKMDMKKTSFENEKFNVVIDKGTLDAMYSDENIDTANGINEMFTEILRILKVVGRYICITLAQEHILNILLSFFPKWCFVRVHEVEIKKNDGFSGLGSKLPVFAFVCTKMKSELLSPVLEMGFLGNSRVKKFKVAEDIKRNVKTLQDFALIKTKLENTSLHKEITVELWTNNESLKEPRYSLTVVDLVRSKMPVHNGDFAVFIVPNGRENNTMFGTESGRKALAEAAGFTRLAVAFLHRGHVYKDLEEIKGELSEKVMDLAPFNMDKGVQVPFLSANVSTSSDIGSRVVVYEGESSVYGSFIVEDIQSEEQFYYRQFVLTDGIDKIQSKIRLMLEPNKKKKSKKRIPDNRFIMQIYEKGILAGLSFMLPLDLQNLDKMEVLIFGLCNVNFINFLMNMIPGIHITCVHCDPDMLDIYRSWFGLDDANRFTFMVNGIHNFPYECHQQLYDAVIIDQMPKKDVKDLQGLSEEVITLINNVIKKNGVLIHTQVDIGDLSNGNISIITLAHFELRTEGKLLSIYVKNEESLEKAWEQAKSKSKELVNYIMGKKKGFYEKQEWQILIDHINELSVP